MVHHPPSVLSRVVMISSGQIMPWFFAIRGSFQDEQTSSQWLNLYDVAIRLAASTVARAANVCLDCAFSQMQLVDN